MKVKKNKQKEKHYRLRWSYQVVGLLSVMLILFTSLPAMAQSPDVRQPLDMMLVIDNSGSMFPRDQIPPGSGWIVTENDPDFLRITGASLFIARLGFAEPNAAEYQVGVISMGEFPPQLVSPLRPLPEVRDTLAAAISAPIPQSQTQIVAALEAAYSELKESPRRRPGNQPAVVLLTDGAPYPSEGQSNDDIKRLVETYPDIPLFVMLLQNPDRPLQDFERYIEFWEGMQRDHDHVRTYRTGSTKEIERTYNQIVALLQNTIPTSGTPLAPGQKLPVYVSKYVQRLVLTIMHERGQPKGNVEVEDPRGVIVSEDDAQVERFRGEDNPVEVISIGAMRLDQAPRDDTWTVTSDAPVVVFLDRVGAYNIKFIEPGVSLTSVTNQYLALERHSPSQPFVAKIKLIDKDGNAITDPQPISGRVVHPDGTPAELRISTDLTPDAEGVYEIVHDFASSYPAALSEPGRYMLMFEAGLADDSSGARIPIARADLLVDVGRGAYCASVATEPLICEAGLPANITVTAGDLDAARPETVRVRVFGAGREAELVPGGGDTFVGSLDDLCQGLLAGLDCDAILDTTFRVRLVSQTTDGSASPPSERDLSVQVKAMPCTPTPTLTPVPPTATPVPPTPTPTPIPDTDGDGINDLDDECMYKAQWTFIPRFKGCPPPLWLLILAGLLGLGVLAFLTFYFIPLLLVRTIMPPPSGYILVCRDGKPQGSYKSIRNIGIGARRSKVTIGSKGHLRIPGLKPVEVRVERRGQEAVVLDGTTGAQRFTIRQTPNPVHTSNTSIVLKFGTDPSQLRC